MSKQLLIALEPRLKTSLSKKANVDEFVRYVSKYIDKNSEILYAFGPTKQLLINDTDKENLFKMCEVNKNEVMLAIKTSDYIDKKWVISNDPFNILSALAIRQFEINKNQHGVMSTLLFLAFRTYASKFSKFFKYEPNENVMRTTMNSLSKKFLLKQTGSLFKALEHTALTCHNTYKDKLIHGADSDIVVYLNGLDARINGLIRNIANEFHSIEKNDQVYFNLDTDSHDADNYHLTDSNSFAIEKLANKCVLNLVTNGPDYKLVGISANINNVTEIHLRNAVNEIIETKNKELNEFVKLILTVFLFDNQGTLDSIASQNFIMECLKIYRKSNVKDVNIERIKAIIDIWLTECSDKYKKTIVREASLADFRRAVYTFFVLSIQRAVVS